MIDSYYGWTFSAQVWNDMFIISVMKLNCYLGRFADRASQYIYLSN